jgi:hypothetical protein
MKKVGFLSCEFINENMSYWLVTGCGLPDFSFLEIPCSVFPGELKSNGLIKEKDYSEIMVFLRDGYEYRFKESQDSPVTLISFSPHSFKNYNWNEMIEVAKQFVSLEDLEGFYQYNIVRKRDVSEYKINDVNYQVSAFLPEEVFAIYGEDYVPQTNPNWISIMSEGNREEFKRILSNFKVVAVRNARGFVNV